MIKFVMFEVLGINFWNNRIMILIVIGIIVIIWINMIIFDISVIFFVICVYLWVCDFFKWWIFSICKRVIGIIVVVIK